MSMQNIKQLREISGAGVLECQQALKESKGDLDKALEILRKQGQKIAQSKGVRTTNEGIVGSYIHSNNKIGVLVKMVCETDFVAKGDEFKELTHNIAMQIAALNPQWISEQDVDKKTIEKEKEIYKQEVDKKKPKQVREKIINGKLKKFYNEYCLLNQKFIKDDKLTIKDLVQDKVAKLGENIQIKDFIRFSI